MVNEYRNEFNKIHKEVRWTFWKILPLGVLVVVILAALGFGLRSMDLWGSTVIERKVFENSYQRTESIKAQIATDEAVLVEIEHQLTSSSISKVVRCSLEAQAAAARVRIATAKGRR